MIGLSSYGLVRTARPPTYPGTPGDARYLLLFREHRFIGIADYFFIQMPPINRSINFRFSFLLFLNRLFHFFIDYHGLRDDFRFRTEPPGIVRTTVNAYAFLHPPRTFNSNEKLLYYYSTGSSSAIKWYENKSTVYRCSDLLLKRKNLAYGFWWWTLSMSNDCNFR